MLTGDPGSTEPLVVTHDGPIATLWLNRPEKRNAVTKAMWEGIAALCADLANRPQRRACSSCAAPVTTSARGQTSESSR